MRKGRALAGCAVVLLSACHGDSNPGTVSVQAPHAGTPALMKHGPTPEELTVGMVEAVTLGKSTVPVGLKFDLGSRPQQGQPLDIVVAVMPQIAAEPAVIQVSGSEGLQLPAAGPIEIPSVEAMQVYRRTITVTPAADGVQLLNVSVTLQHDEISETRVFTLPVIVAPSASAAAGKHPAAGASP